MKVSVSLSADDVRFLDECAAARGVSRSAVLQQAVVLLRARQLGAAYAEAWDEWAAGDGPSWDATAADGLGKG
jgi:predicted transcriptional regulator